MLKYCSTKINTIKPEVRMIGYIEATFITSRSLLPAQQYMVMRAWLNTSSTCIGIQEIHTIHVYCWDVVHIAV